MKKGDKILDLGPGMGYFTFPIGRMVGKHGIVYAADIQNQMLLHIEKRIIKEKWKNIRTYLIKDKIRINEKVDFVLMFWMLHEIKNIEIVIDNLKEILNQNGKILIVEPIIHVTKKDFTNEIDIMIKNGFKIIKYPKINLSRSVLIEASPRQARGECSACTGSAARHRKVKKSISSSLANPATSGGVSARCRGLKKQLTIRVHPGEG